MTEGSMGWPAAGLAAALGLAAAIGAVPGPAAASAPAATPEAHAPGGKTLEAGDQAPAFALAGSDGATHALADFKGKQAVVVAWFPKAFTGG